MMEAAVLRRFDAAPTIEPMPVPQPGPGEVRITVRAAGVTLVDALITAGRYQIRPDLPWIPGSECAGLVDAIGAGVEEYAVGDRVCGLGWSGVTAQYVCLPVGDIARVPDGLEIETASVLRVAYTTAWHALVDRARAVAGERLLVLGASGAVGSAAVAVGTWLGLDVTAFSRRSSAIETLSGDYDLVFDAVGGEASVGALSRLTPGGRFCVIGFAAGEIPRVAFNRILLREAAVIGVNIGAFTRRAPEQARANFARILALTSQGLALPRIAHRFALAQTAQAYALAASGAGEGRIVIIP